jgi:hypothetical protein
LARLTFVDALGNVSDQIPLSRTGDVARPPGRLGCSKTGALALLARPDLRSASEEADFSTLTAPVFVLSPTGNPTRVLDSAPVIQWAREAGTYRPLSPTTYLAFSDSLLYVGQSDTTVVRVFDLAGTLRATISLPLPSRVATVRHAERAAAAQAIWMANADLRRRIEARLLSIPRPAYLPYYSALFVDAIDRLWLVLSFPGDSVTALRAHTTDGIVVGNVLVPVELEVFEVGQDYVIGAHEDPTTGAPHVLVYGFTVRG